MTLQSFANTFAFATIVVKTCIIVRTNTQRLNPNRQMTKQTNDKIDKADNSSIISSSPLFITSLHHPSHTTVQVQSQQTYPAGGSPIATDTQAGGATAAVFLQESPWATHTTSLFSHPSAVRPSQWPSPSPSPLPLHSQRKSQCQNATARSSILHTRPRLTPWLPLA